MNRASPKDLEHFLKRAEFVDFYRINHVVYDASGGNRIFENTDLKFLPYNVTEVRGDWIKVKKGYGREFCLYKNM